MAGGVPPLPDTLIDRLARLNAETDALSWPARHRRHLLGGHLLFSHWNDRGVR